MVVDPSRLLLVPTMAMVMATGTDMAMDMATDMVTMDRPLAILLKQDNTTLTLIFAS